jgi:hypothetical protein
MFTPAPVASGIGGAILFVGLSTTPMRPDKYMARLARGLIMPIDLGLVSERKGEVAQAQAQTEVTILLVFVIITLAMLVLLFADQSFSKATIELMCLF